MQKHFILVAEDDFDDRFLLQTAFQEKGFHDKVEFVGNGVELFEFLAKIQENKTGHRFPYFILLDLNMPKKDGREVLLEIKQHPVYKKIPIVVFTTTKNEQEIQRCYELGANSYVVKPASFEALLTTLDNIRTYWSDTVAIPW